MNNKQRIFDLIRKFDKSFKNINENTNINEVGDANLPPYEWKRTQVYNNWYYYFKTDDDVQYKVSFDISDLMSIVGFTANSQYGVDINSGNQYRVMSTITAIVKDYVDINKPIALNFRGVKTKGNSDNRRNNMYLQYVHKHLPSHYEIVKSDFFEYIIRLKLNDNSIKQYIAVLNGEDGVYEFNKYLIVYPELIKNITNSQINNIGDFMKLLVFTKYPEVANSENMIKKIDTAIELFQKHPELVKYYNVSVVDCLKNIYSFKNLVNYLSPEQLNNLKNEFTNNIVKREYLDLYVDRYGIQPINMFKELLNIN